ncbi:MAG: polyprenyl synthetase family protein [Nitrospinae bacterium]|nr:polyprenyl synthetase family protein [Nitrospinota bacterium]MBF0633575.1 polyprenyl synthetase family protein [Nitrospinota bacterium]
MSSVQDTKASVDISLKYKEAVAPYAPDMERVEKDILKHFQSDVALIPQVSEYLAGSGGKRIRPILLTVASRLCGYTGASRHITLSVVAEFIHAATLLHDDVVDDADQRRGMESANIKFGNCASVLVGDFLFAKSFVLMSQDGDIRVINAMSEATRRLAEGEVLQLVNTLNLTITEDIYTDTIYRKTGALIEACCRLGAILGGASKEKEEALAQYGRNIGIAFQLVDDALDFVGDARGWGKPLGADLEEGRVTLPLIRALAMADESEAGDIKSAMESDTGREAKLGAVIMTLKKYDTISYAMEQARWRVEEAKSAISACFEPSSHLDTMRAIADYVVDRKI